ncbi:hypothetical protein [Haloglomus litoreum]|uniref:hypothetical protein n=1 Tax=Haloglomus litoreum TaxID=3034026 RepID=UPI0023E77271|nr:hypothetical protein [Haloglomus sp. DT116]
MVTVETLVALLVLVFLLPVLLVGAAAGYVVARLFGLPSQLRVYGSALGVGRWTAALPTTVALAVVFGVEFAAGIPGEGEPGATLASGATAGLFVGAFALSVGLGNLLRYLRVRTVTDAMDATDGRVTVSGTAEPGPEGTVEAPLSGEPCLAWAVRVREHHGIGRRGIRGLARTDHGGVPFEVRDGTGSVRVDPESLELGGWSVPPRSGDHRVEARDGLPDCVAAYRDDLELGDGDRRVYEERRLTATSPVTATGRVGTEDGVATVGAPGALYDERATAIQQSRKRRVLVGAAGALVMAGSTVLLAAVVGLV